MEERKLKMGYLGNGITFWEDGDNEYKGHISVDRRISINDKDRPFTKDNLKKIYDIADKGNMILSNHGKEFGTLVLSPINKPTKEHINPVTDEAYQLSVEEVNGKKYICYGRTIFSDQPDKYNDIPKIVNPDGKKFELTNYTKEYNGHTLRRIRALKDLPGVKAGTLGGYVEGEHNLSQKGKCWINDRAMVYDEAEVKDDARVSDSSVICGYAHITGESRVSQSAHISDYVRLCDYSEVFGSANLCGNVHLFDDSMVGDDSKLSGNVQLHEESIVCGSAELTDNASLFDNAKVNGNCEISGNVSLYDQSVVKGSAKLTDNVSLFDNAKVDGAAELSGNVSIMENAKVSGHVKLCGYTVVSGSDEIKDQQTANKYLKETEKNKITENTL